jgi:hypothetical protein
MSGRKLLVRVLTSPLWLAFLFLCLLSCVGVVDWGSGGAGDFGFFVAEVVIAVLGVMAIGVLGAWLALRSFWFRAWWGDEPTDPVEREQAQVWRVLRDLRGAFGRGGARRSVLVLGLPGAGRTSLVSLGGGSRLALLDASRSAAPRGPTRELIVAADERCVMMEVPTSWNRDAHMRRWFLDFFRGGRLAIDVVVVCLPLPVMPPGADELRALRTWLEDVQVVAGRAPPVHVVFTHLDQLVGFEVLMESAEPEPWGIGAGPWSAVRGNLATGLRERWPNLVDALERRRGAEAARPDWRKAWFFPDRVAALCEPVTHIVDALLGEEDQRAARMTPFGGVWLVSLGTGGPEVDPIADRFRDLTGGAAPRTVARRPTSGAAAAGALVDHILQGSADPPAVPTHLRRSRVLAVVSALITLLVAGTISLWQASRGFQWIGRMEREAHSVMMARPSDDNFSASVDRAWLLARTSGQELNGAPWPACSPTPVPPLGVPGNDTPCSGPEIRLTGAPVPGDRAWWGMGEDAIRRGARAALEGFVEGMIPVAMAKLASDGAQLERGISLLGDPPSPKEPMPMEKLNWVGSATELRARVRRLRLDDSTDPTTFRADAAAALVDIVLSARPGGPESSETQGELRDLVVWWLSGPGGAKLQAALPSQATVTRQTAWFDRLRPADTVLWEHRAQSPEREVFLRSDLLGMPGRRLIPRGFDEDGCSSYAASARGRAANKSGSELFTTAEQVEGEAWDRYSQVYRDVWAAWLRDLRPGLDARDSSSGSQLALRLEGGWTVGTGDLDVVLSQLGRGKPAPGSSPDPRCSCVVRDWQIGLEVVSASGALNGAWTAAQTAMGKVAGELRAGQEAAMGADLVAGNGSILAAHDAVDVVVRAIEAWRPPDDLCDGPDSGAPNLVAAFLREAADASLLASSRRALGAWKAEVEADWAEVVVPGRALLAAFPFDPGRPNDADAAEIGGVLGPEGELMAFFTERLAPLASRGSLWPGGPSVSLTAEARRMQSALATAAPYMVGLAVPSVFFLSPPTRQAASPFTRTWLEVDGVEVYYNDNSSKIPRRVVVKPGSLLQFKASADQRGGTTCQSRVFEGNFSMLHMVAASHPRPMCGSAATALVLPADGCIEPIAFSYREEPRGQSCALSTFANIALADSVVTFVVP